MRPLSPVGCNVRAYETCKAHAFRRADDDGWLLAEKEGEREKHNAIASKCRFITPSSAVIESGAVRVWVTPSERGPQFSRLAALFLDEHVPFRDASRASM